MTEAEFRALKEACAKISAEHADFAGAARIRALTPEAAGVTLTEGVVLTQQMRTLIEDFNNPCFAGKIHNEIPRDIGLLVLAAAQEPR